MPTVAGATGFTRRWKRTRSRRAWWGAIPAPDRSRSPLAPIFRDRDELPSATDLSRKVNEALVQSANLIVICSPQSAASRWCQRGNPRFQAPGSRPSGCFCLVVDGEPNASDLPGRASEECFAPALRFVTGDDGNLTAQRTEPIAADARLGKDGKHNAKLKLVSGLLDIGFDELRQREQQRRTRRMVGDYRAGAGGDDGDDRAGDQRGDRRAMAPRLPARRAERRQKQAEHLVGFMLGDLNDKLAQVQRLDIMEAVDDQAMQYFQSLPTTDVTDEALAQRAKALGKDRQRSHGPGPPARGDAGVSIITEVRRSACRRRSEKPGTANGVRAHVVVHRQELLVPGATRSTPFARSAPRRPSSCARRRSRHAITSCNSNWPRPENNIGHVLEARGRLDEAMAHYRRVLALCGDLVAAEPGNGEWATALGSAHNNLGSLALLRGDLATAVAEYRADDSIEAALTARDPKDNNQREQMAIARATLGRTLALSGISIQGFEGCASRSTSRTSLTLVDPNNTSFQEDVALYGSQWRIAAPTRRFVRGDATGRAFAGQLARADATGASNARWQQGLAEATLEYAEQLRAGHQADAARVQALAAEKTLGALLLQQPDDRAVLLAATATKLLLADLDEKQDAPRRRACATKRCRSSLP
jgi:tetratricopeptide (TPR) repeat protein